MIQTFLGRAIYWRGVYRLDGLLVAGPAQLSSQVARLCELAVRECIITRHHGHGRSMPAKCFLSKLGCVTLPPCL